MVPQVREVLHRPLYVNSRVTLVSITFEAEIREVFVEGMHYLSFPPRFPCTKHQLTNRGLVEKLVRNLDRFHVRHFAIHLPRQMHQS
jgi:hypothetical protein